MLEFFAQQLAVRKSFRIRHQTCAHGTNGLILAAPFLNCEPTMPLNQFPFFLQARPRESFTYREIMFHLIEDPGRTHRRATNHCPVSYTHLTLPTSDLV